MALTIRTLSGETVVTIENNDLDTYLKEQPDVTILDSLGWLYREATQTPYGIQAQHLPLIRKNIAAFAFVVSEDPLIASFDLSATNQTLLNLESPLGSINAPDGNVVTIHQISMTPTMEESSYAFLRGATNQDKQDIIENALKCIKSIEPQMFHSCRGLTKLTIPKSVTSIGDGAFMDCRGLKELTILGNIDSIGNGAFMGCYGLTELTILGNIDSIGDVVFYGCSGLTKLTILGNIDSIGKEAFRGCYSLTELTILGNIDSIGEGAFKDCPLVTVIVTPNNYEKNTTYFDQNSISIQLEYIREADEESLHTNPTAAPSSCALHSANLSTDVDTPLVVESAALLGQNDTP